MDRTVFVEAQSDIASLDISKTSEFPEVLSGKLLDQENRRQDIEVDESSHHLDSSSSSVFFLHAVVRWKGLVETKVALL